MGTIKKNINLSKVTWEVRIRKHNHPTITKTFSLKSHAERWARDTELKIETGVFDFGFEPSEETLGDVLERYLQEVTPQKRGQDIEAVRIRKFINNPIAAIKVGYFKPIHIIRYRDERLKQVSSGTVKKELVLLGHVFETAIKEWNMGLASNPVRLISKPKENKQRDRRLEGNEEDRLLKSCGESENIYLSALVIVAIETGMRRGELLGLQRKDVNFTKRTAYLSITKNGSSRTVPLSTRAVEVLNNLPIDLSGLVFPVSITALRGLWTRSCKRAGIEDLHFHDLRHEATSRFFEKGLNVMEVGAITGHKDLRMLQRYTHLKAEDLAMKLG